MTKKKNKAAVALGRRGGKVTSEQKKKSSARNLEKARASRAAKLAKTKPPTLDEPTAQAVEDMWEIDVWLPEG